MEQQYTVRVDTKAGQRKTYFFDEEAEANAFIAVCEDVVVDGPTSTLLFTEGQSMSNEVVIPPASWADAGTPELTPEQVQMIASGLHRITDPNVTRRLAVQLQQAHERILANIDRHRDLENQLRRERDENQQAAQYMYDTLRNIATCTNCRCVHCVAAAEDAAVRYAAAQPAQEGKQG